MKVELWRRAEALFGLCADLPAEERDEFLERHCGDGTELRNAVEDLLSGDRAGDLVRSAIGAAAGELAGRQADRWEGLAIGAWTLQSRIAQGGMGVIYSARRSDAQYEQQVAVKLLTGTLTSDDLRARFIAERQILADLNHPYIAQLLDGGETAEGVPYLVMEYIDGTPIDRYCNDLRLPLGERLELFMQVCDAVHFAHRHLVIHRDIKPSNILVTADGAPKLLDFGIAKLLDDGAEADDASLTVYGARVLTPRYASPEQILGERVTTASDVYSLGLLLYSLLCDDYPYLIDSTSRPREVEDTIVSGIPAAPSARLAKSPQSDAIARARRTTPSKLRKALRGDLDTIVLKALRKEPHVRYGTPREFATDLRRHLERRPIIARRPTAAYLLSRYWLRQRTAAIGVLAAVIAVLGGATAATVGFIQARESEQTALAEARNAEAISEFLVSLFQEADPNNSAGNERSVHDILRLGLERVDTELAGSQAVQARVLETLSSVYKALADYPQAANLLRRAVAAHEVGAPDDLAGRARMLNDLGDLLRIQSRHADAAAYIERAIGLHEAAGTTVTDAHADAVNNLSLVYEESARVDDARRTMEEALRLRRALFDAPHPKIALSLHNLAWHHERAGDLELAARYARDAIAMRIAVFGEVHPRVASTVGLLSRILRTGGDLDAAEQHARRAVSISERIFETGHPDLSFPVYQLAAILHEKGDVPAAEALFRQVAAWERVSLGPDSHALGMSIKAWARTLIDLGDYEQAESLLFEAHSIFERLPGGSADALADTVEEINRLNTLRRNAGAAPKGESG